MVGPLLLGSDFYREHPWMIACPAFVTAAVALEYGAISMIAPHPWWIPLVCFGSGAVAIFLGVSALIATNKDYEGLFDQSADAPSEADL